MTLVGWSWSEVDMLQWNFFIGSGHEDQGLHRTTSYGKLYGCVKEGVPIVYYGALISVTSFQESLIDFTMEQKVYVA